MIIDTVFLDAGGVLVHPNWPRIAGILAGMGAAADPATLARAELEVTRALDEPEIIARSDDSSRWVVFMREVLVRAGVVEPPGAIDALWALHGRENLWEHVPDEVPGALERLRAGGRRLVVVSNANGTVEAKLNRVGLGGYLDGVVDSGTVGVEKPDPRIFRLAMDLVGAAPERCVHVGDFYNIDVVGAQAAGVAAVLLDKADLHVGRHEPRVRSLSAFADLVTARAPR